MPRKGARIFQILALVHQSESPWRHKLLECPTVAEHVPEDNLCDGPEGLPPSCSRAGQPRRGWTMTIGGVNSRIGAGVGKQMFDDEVQALIETAHLYGKKWRCIRMAPMASRDRHQCVKALTVVNNRLQCLSPSRSRLCQMGRARDAPALPAAGSSDTDHQ
jgi:hypothetical protein